jgi:hypothetical protein
MRIYFLKIQIPYLSPTWDLNFKILYSYRIKQKNYTKFELKNVFECYIILPNLHYKEQVFGRPRAKYCTFYV